MDPNNPMDETLKASAQARRAAFGADPKMPNPMRARLHDEIARRDNEEARPVSRGFGFWLPRFALATAVAAAVIGLPVWMSLQDARSRAGKTISMESNASKEAPMPAVDALTAKLAQKADLGADRVAEAKADVLKKSAKALANERDEPEMARAKTALDVATTENQDMSAGAPAAAVAMTPALEAPASKTLADSAAAGAAMTKEESSGGLKQFTEVKIPPAPQLQNNANQNAVVSKGIVSASSSLARNQNFRQLTQNSENRGTRFNSQLQRAMSVLNNFQVEQKGTQIRIVDEDGSTYTGKIEQITRADSRSLANSVAQKSASQSYASHARAPQPAESADTTEFRFNASGYSDRLHRRLVFEGNYLIPRGQENANEPAKPGQKKDETSARIVGTARVSGESAIEIDAVAVP